MGCADWTHSGCGSDIKPDHCKKYDCHDYAFITGQLWCGSNGWQIVSYQVKAFEQIDKAWADKYNSLFENGKVFTT
jgi:hypothetical protein